MGVVCTGDDFRPLETVLDTKEELPVWIEAKTGGVGAVLLQEMAGRACELRGSGIPLEEVRRVCIAEAEVEGVDGVSRGSEDERAWHVAVIGG